MWLMCLQLKSTAWVWQDTVAFVQLTIKMSLAKLIALRTVHVFRTMSRSVVICFLKYLLRYVKFPYFRFRLYSYRDGRFCLIFASTAH